MLLTALSCCAGVGVVRLLAALISPYMPTLKPIIATPNAYVDCCVVVLCCHAV
jgi:hypothetical protein